MCEKSRAEAVSASRRTTTGPAGLVADAAARHGWSAVAATGGSIVTGERRGRRRQRAGATTGQTFRRPTREPGQLG